MRVKMLTNIVGRPSYASGDVVDLEPRIAKAWIDEGYCQPVREEPAEQATSKK